MKQPTLVAHNPFSAKFGARYGEQAHLRYGASLRCIQDQETERSDEFNCATKSTNGWSQEDAVVCSQNALKMEPPETVDDELPSLFTQMPPSNDRVDVRRIEEWVNSWNVLYPSESFNAIVMVS